MSWETPVLACKACREYIICSVQGVILCCIRGGCHEQKATPPQELADIILTASDTSHILDIAHHPAQA